MKKTIAVLICVIMVFLPLCSCGSSGSSNVNTVVDIINKYKSSLKNPDSLIIRGDIFYVSYRRETVSEIKSGDFFVVFTASGTNSYGALVTEMPVYKGNKYLADFTENFDESVDLSIRAQLAHLHITLNRWNTEGKSMATADSPWQTVEMISGKTVAAKVHCDWKES